MTYLGAVRLQTLACRGMLASMRLMWAEKAIAPLADDTIQPLCDQMVEGQEAAKLLWEAGIRFSYTRVLTEDEVRKALP